MKTNSILILASLFVTGISQAGTVEDSIAEKLKSISPQLQTRSVQPAPIDGFYVVVLSEGQMIYTDKEASFFFTGELYQTAPTGITNLTENSKKALRLSLLKDIPPSETIDFTPTGEIKASIVVFTDITCGYCRKLHSEMADINARGIEVRYLAYPRAGINSQAYRDMVSVWCADNPQQAMTNAKLGSPVESKECDNPVASQYRLGQQFNVTGTPTLIFADGSVAPGYLPAERLAERLGIQ